MGRRVSSRFARLIALNGWIALLYVTIEPFIATCVLTPASPVSSLPRPTDTMEV